MGPYSGVEKPGCASEYAAVPLCSISRFLNASAKLPQRNTNNGGSRRFKSTGDSLQNTCFSTSKTSQVRSCSHLHVSFTVIKTKYDERFTCPIKFSAAVYKHHTRNMIKTRMRMIPGDTPVHVNAHMVNRFAC